LVVSWILRLFGGRCKPKQRGYVVPHGKSNDQDKKQMHPVHDNHQDFERVVLFPLADKRSHGRELGWVACRDMWK
jgi:hypothetical protein